MQNTEFIDAITGRKNTKKATNNDERVEKWYEQINNLQ